MKNLIIAIVIAVIFVFGIGYFSTNVLLKKASYKVLDFIEPRAEARGVELKTSRFETVRPSSFTSITWNNFIIGAVVAQNGPFAKNREFSVLIRELKISLKNIFTQTIQVEANDLDIESPEVSEILSTARRQREGVYNGNARIVVSLNFFSKKKFRKQIKNIYQNLLSLARNGKSQIPIYFEGTSFFKIGSVFFQAELRTHEINGECFLTMSPHDIKQIADLTEEKLTNAEINILSHHPLLAPQLFRIRNYVHDKAMAAKAKNSQVPYDTYYHVLGSFLLTKEFGAKFAKKLTDAHEIEPVRPNTPAEHAIDYQNNFMGRHYAEQGYSENSILNRVMTDPQVIRSSNDPIRKETA